MPNFRNPCSILIAPIFTTNAATIGSVYAEDALKQTALGDKGPALYSDRRDLSRAGNSTNNSNKLVHSFQKSTKKAGHGNH